LIIKEKAILLTKNKYGESDLILKLLTSNGEIYSAIAKSALKSRKRFGGGVLEPTHYVNVTLTRRTDDSSGERMAVLNEAQIIDDFKGLKTDYDRLDLALQLVRVVATVAREGDAHADIFNLLGHTLKAAETAKSLSRLRTQFTLKMLHLQGVLPHDMRFLPFLKTPIKETDSLDQFDLVLDSGVSAESDLLLQRYLN
jgi:DNA repair protein RecO (recombination protein O)